ncbi:DNA helicase IV [Vibrio sp.]|uniref:DNA helicase IV n=1 Tax=Vibrio sp. TaxID=678 RepID=UPI003D0BD11E
MQLIATNTAKYLIQKEFHQVEIDNNYIVASSTTREERIPFSVWNGDLQIKRGLFWGSLRVFAHPENGIQRSWLIQGLPWADCQEFAHKAVALYQSWHLEQCRQLNLHLPEWEQDLRQLLRQPSYLSHSAINSWLEKIESQFTEMNITLDEAEQRMPTRVGQLRPWLEETDGQLQQRNQTWLEMERHNWEVLFSQIESSPLNLSQQQAVLLNDDSNLVLAGAGSGKTSVLTARVAYLLQSHLATASDILLLAFGREAAEEMQQRLTSKIGLEAAQVEVATFHKLGLQIIREVENNPVEISPLALDDKLRQAWCIDWLKKHWMTPTNFKRWQKHLAKWPIAYLVGDDELGSHVENPKLINWLEQQLSQLASMGHSKKQIQESLVDLEDYPRLNSELSLVWPCYQAWQQHLADQQQIDFNLMISKATKYVQQGKFKKRWHYVMIDEYQDISPQRLALIEALCSQDKQPRPVLFAVGDDWQSIYQFAGSDVDLTTGFANRFPNSTIHHLDTTYRFNNQIGEVANRFVQQNPSQLPKQLQSVKQQKTKAVHLVAMSKLEKVLDKLNRKVTSKKQVLLLARNHYHQPELLSEWQKQFANLTISFMTCHASKGKEADYVVVLSVDEGQFPTKRNSLHLDSALTRSSEEFPHAEERRLFYVALTRAKQAVWVAYNGAGSSFVEELKNGHYAVSNK